MKEAEQGARGRCSEMSAAGGVLTPFPVLVIYILSSQCFSCFKLSLGRNYDSSVLIPLVLLF